MFKPSLFILFGLCIHNSSCLVDDLYDAGKAVWNLDWILNGIIPDSSINGTKLKDVFTSGKVTNQQIISQMNEIFGKLDNIEESMNSKKFKDSLKLESSALKLRICVERFEGAIEDIDYVYKEFQKYMKGEYHNSDDALKELLRRMIADIQGDMTWIRKVVIGESVPLLNNMNIIKAISANAVGRGDELCGGPQLIATILAQLFKMVVIAEIKTHFMLSLADVYQYREEYSGWSRMILFSIAQFENNFASYVAVFPPNMHSADSLYFRACDLVNGTWIRDENFYELEKTIQMKVFRYDSKQCKSASCSDIWSNKPGECLRIDYDQTTRCSLTTPNCYDLGAIETCVLESGPYNFQYMNSTKLGALGRNYTCPRDNGYISKVGRDSDTHHSACACDCYGYDNEISLVLMESRAESNWVITGLKFVRKNGVLHIQPREGRLEANGYISPDTQRWIPIPSGTPVHTIDIVNRTFFLDDVNLPQSHALTGVKFIKQTRGTVTGFAIQIIGRPFNYRSGKVSSKKSEMSMETLNIEMGPSMSFPKVPPTYTDVPYRPKLLPFAYVSLERSELSADFGQSTLPFFDAVPIVTSPPSVLGGIGIFYKGTPNHAGFLSLRVFGISYTEYLSDFQRKAIVNGKVLFNSSEHE